MLTNMDAGHFIDHFKDKLIRRILSKFKMSSQDRWAMLNCVEFEFWSLNVGRAEWWSLMIGHKTHNYEIELENSTLEGHLAKWNLVGMSVLRRPTKKGPIFRSFHLLTRGHSNKKNESCRLCSIPTKLESHKQDRRVIPNFKTLFVYGQSMVMKF